MDKRPVVYVPRKFYVHESEYDSVDCVLFVSKAHLKQSITEFGTNGKRTTKFVVDFDGYDIDVKNTDNMHDYSVEWGAHIDKSFVTTDYAKCKAHVDEINKQLFENPYYAGSTTSLLLNKVQKLESVHISPEEMNKHSQDDYILGVTM